MSKFYEIKLEIPGFAWSESKVETKVRRQIDAAHNFPLVINKLFDLNARARC